MKHIQLIYQRLRFHSQNNRQLLVGGSVLITLSMVANILNFFYNAYLGRVLSLTDFAQISLMAGLLSFVQTLSSPFNSAINYKTSYLIGKYSELKAYSFLSVMRRHSFLISLMITIIWLISLKILLYFFPSSSPLLLISFAIVILVSLLESANRGFLNAQLHFGDVAIINFIDPLIRMITAVLVVHTKSDDLAYLGIPFGILASFLIGFYLVQHQRFTPSKSLSKELRTFPKKFYIQTLLTSLTSLVFLSVDVLLANHYLSAKQAGGYGLLTLVGKMVYFLAALITPFALPFLSRSEGAKGNTHKSLLFLIAANTLAGGSGFVLFCLLGNWTLPLLYGHKVSIILPFVTFFGFGMLCFTISKVFINYFLVKRLYSSTVMTIILAILQCILIAMFHQTIQAIALDMTIIWVLNLIAMYVLYLLEDRIQLMEKKAYAFIPIS